MNDKTALPPETADPADLAARLADYDEALRDGGTLDLHPNPVAVPADAELQRAQACLRLLEEAWPRRKEGAPAPPPSKPIPDLLGRFQIRRELGRGGFGTVYLAFDPHLGREVALKIPHAHALADPDFQARFQREARAAAALDHPNLVQVFEVGEANGISYIAAAYCPGMTLAAWLREQTEPVPFADAVRLVRTLAEAVDHAHGRGVIHRDLKPANVLLTGGRSQELGVRSQESGIRSQGAGVRNQQSSNRIQPDTCLLTPDSWTPKITDFGLAKTIDMPSQATQTGTMMGTPCYMAPEQAESRLGPIGRTADVYALGVILYELLTGRPPFQADSPLETLVMLRQDDPLPPSRLRHRLPRDLETICLKCLHKEPHKRYAGAAELADDLGRFLDHQPILARPAGPIERGVKWMRRRPALATLLVSVPVVAALGFAGIFWQWRATVSALGETVAEKEKTQRAHDAAKAHLYLNQIAMAANELRAHQASRAERLLLDTDPALRHWEWKYLIRQAQTDLHTLAGHGDEIQDIAWSRDGELIASGCGTWNTGRNGELIIWDARTGQLLRTLSQDIGTVHSVAFSPDSRLLVSGSHDLKVRLWDPRTGEMLRELPGHKGRVSCVAFSPDGKTVASGSTDKSVRICNVETGKTVHVFTDHKDSVWCLAFSPNGQWLVAGDRNGAARIMDVALGKVLHIEKGLGDLRAAAFSPDGAWAALGGYPDAIWMWDMSRPELKPTVHHTGAGPITGIVFSPDGRHLAWSATDGTIKMRDVRSQRDVQAFRGQLGVVYGLAFSPDGRALAAGGADQKIRIWDTTAGSQPTTAVESGGQSRIWELSCEPDGSLLACGGLGRSARLWDVTNRKTLLSLPLPVSIGEAAARSRDGRYFAWVADNNQLNVVDLPADRVVCNRVLAAGSVTGLTFSPNSREFAWGGGDGLVRICAADTGAELGTLGPHASGVSGIAYHPNGRQLVTVARDSTFSLWDLATHELVTKFGDAGRTQEQFLDQEPEPFKLSQVGVTRLAFSPDGLRLAAAHVQRPLEIWDMTTRRVALTLTWDGLSIYCAGWSADGQRLALARGGQTRVLDTAELSRDDRRQAAAAQTMDWHNAQGRLALRQRHGFGALFHFDRLVAAAPKNPQHHEGRARALAELDRWPEAVTEYDLAAKGGIQDPDTQYNRAVLALQVGDQATYKKICADLLQRHETTQNLNTANTVAWTCLLVPAALENPYRALPLARRAAFKQLKEYAYQNTLATALYRAGHPQEAIDQFTTAIQLHELKTGNVYDWAYLAMAHAAVGNTEQARTWLDKALAAPLQVDWQNRVEMRLLLAEARKCVEAHAKPQAR